MTQFDFTIATFAASKDMTLPRARRAVTKLLAENKIRSVGIVDLGKRGKKPEGFVYVEAVDLPEPSAA